MKDRLLSLGRVAAHRLREAALYPRLLAPHARPRIAFLPPDGRVMSSLLRGYNLARAANGMGWNAIVLPKQLEAAQRARVLRLFQPDIAVLMGSRLAMNSHKLLDGIPYLYDLDDADFHNPKLAPRIRQDVTHAAGIIAGSQYVADWCAALNPNVMVSWTGSPAIATDWPDHRDRPPVVTWAQSAPLRYAAEFDLVTDVLARLAVRRPGVRFRLYGCQPGDMQHPRIAALQALPVTVELKPMMAYDSFIRSLGETSVGLSAIAPDSLFSQGKSFGKILAYLSAGVPVIASDAADHGQFFRPETGIVSNDPAHWAAQIDALLADPLRRNRMALAAGQDFDAHLTTGAAARRLLAAAKPLLRRDRQDRTGPAHAGLAGW